MKKLIALGATVLALAIPATGVSATSATKAASPITGVSYSPNPLYNDEIGLYVNFTATRKAKPGYEWGVMMTIFGKEPVLSCASVLVSWDPNFGGNKKKHLQRAGKHTVLLLGKGLPSQQPESNYLCRGRADVRVVERKIGTASLGTWHETLKFRIPEAP